MKNNTVSIIMPAHNSADFIKESIDSVLAQTYKDWELIVIDDGSTDNTYSIVQECALTDSRIVLLKNEKNIGAARTRNKGLEKASGRYIAFLDSNDLWFPQKLEKQLAFMQKNGYAFTFSSYQQITVTGLKKRIIHAKKQMTGDQILGDTSIGCLTVMLDKNIFGDFTMPNICHMEDNATWQKLLSNGEVGYGLNEILAYYRKGCRSLTSNKFLAIKKQWRVYRTYYHFDVCKSILYFTKYAINALKKYYF